MGHRLQHHSAGWFHPSRGGARRGHQGVNGGPEIDQGVPRDASQPFQSSGEAEALGLRLERLLGRAGSHDLEPPVVADLGEGVEEEIDPALRGEPTDDPEHRNHRWVARQRWGGDRQAIGPHHRAWGVETGALRQVIEGTADDPAERRGAVAHPTRLPACSHSGRSTHRGGSHEHEGDLEVAGHRGARLRSGSPRVSPHMEEIRADVAHQRAEGLARPAEIHRVGRFAASLDPLEADQAIGFGVAVRTRDDRLHVESDERAENPTRGWGGGEEKDAHSDKDALLAVTFHPMRILQLAKYYWPRSGGMERVVQGLAEGLVEQGHEVEVVAVTAFGDPRPGERRRASVTRAWSLAPMGSQELAPTYMAAAWRRADVIHLHHPHSLADVAYAFRPSLAPLVVTQHADYPSAKYKIPGWYTLRRAEAIIVPSAAHIALSRELKGWESKVTVIPFGIDQRRWELVPPRPPGNPPRAIFIGHLEPWKGVDFLLRALAQVPDLRLDIVGSGPERNRLETLARALAVTDRAKFWGEYPDEDLPRRMADADFLVLPSVSVDEMFGLVLLEAMAAGRPVITTAVPSGVREVTDPGVTGLEVPIRDVDALARAMRTLAENRELRERMGAAGRERVRQRFTVDRMTEAHLELYHQVRAPKSKV